MALVDGEPFQFDNWGLEAPGEPHLHEVPFDEPAELTDKQLVLEGDIPSVTIDRWEDQVFDFGKNRLVGNELVGMSPNRGSRMRSVVDAIRVNPQNHGALHMDDERPIYSQISIEKFLDHPITEEGQQTTHRQLLPLEFSLPTIEALMESENNPVWQALQQLREEYQDILGPDVMAEVIHDTILATQNTRIASLYRSHRRALHEQVDA